MTATMRLLYCTQIWFVRFLSEMTALVDLSGVKLRERRSHKIGKSAFSIAREYFTNNHIIICLSLIYNFSEFTTHILFYIIISISPCHLLHN